jgi:DNA gyrase subunit A
VVEETSALKERFATQRRTVILTDEKPGDSIVTEAELAVPEGPQIVIATTNGVQRLEASGFVYRVKAGATARAVEAHRFHLRTEADDTVILVSDRGRAWWGTVGRVPTSAHFEALGLARGEKVVGMGILKDDSYLVLGTRAGQVKRVKVEDVKSSAEALWAVVTGLSGPDDGVLFAGVGDDDAQVMFFGTSRANRFASSQVAAQATRSARGVAGIKVRKGDRLLSGHVLTDATDDVGVVVVSKNGFVKRVPLKEFPVQGRAGQGVLLLNQTPATGPVVAAKAGPMKGSVDLISSDGKRQRLTRITTTNRANRGSKVTALPDVAEVAVL